MNLGLSDSPLVELIVVVALTVSILTAWRMLSRKRGLQGDVDPLAEADSTLSGSDHANSLSRKELGSN